MHRTTTITLGLVLIAGYAIAAEPQGDEVLLTAIEWRESSNDPDVPNGDDGASRGSFQIGKLYWTDGCQGAGVDYDYETCVRDREKCITVIRGYWKKYHAKTDEEKARFHNGGLRGMYKKSTEQYWRDVKARMEEIRKETK